MPIIMFHYVKTNGNYYHYDLNLFEKFVSQNSENIVSLNDYISCKDDNKYVLSFDDGTIDHFTNVFPILKKYNVTGVFSVCDNIFHKNILNIQKIHLLIERIGINDLYNELTDILPRKICQQYKNIYIDKECFIKKMLQKILPKNISCKILNRIANQYKINFKKQNLYLNKHQLREMQSLGNEFLYHTKNHLWLNEISYKKQLKEIKNIRYYIKKYKFLNVLSLPFGGYNNDTIQICEKLHIDKVLAISHNNIKRKTILTRVDCNSFK